MAELRNNKWRLIFDFTCIIILLIVLAKPGLLGPLVALAWRPLILIHRFLRRRLLIKKKQSQRPAIHSTPNWTELESFDSSIIAPVRLQLFNKLTAT